MTNEYSSSLEKAKHDLMKIKGVVGVGLTHSKVTEIGNEYQIVVYVEDESILKSIPSTVYGIPVVYKITGKAEIHAFAYTEDVRLTKSLQTYTSKYRPFIPGISGGLQGSEVKTTGTLGCFAKDLTGKVVIISNNHVIAWNIGTIEYNGIYGEPIIQPGIVDGGTNLDVVGTLEKWVNIKDSGNTIDAAYAIPTTNFQEPDLCNIYVNESISPIIGTIVKKSGRTTGCVDGTIESESSAVNVEYTLHTNEGTIKYIALFDDILFISNPYNIPTSKNGDSGSFWVSKNNNSAIGLNFAGTSDGTSISCKAKNIESLLGIKFGLGTLNMPTDCNSTSALLSFN